MAGPSIVVRVLGDTKGLSGAFSDTAKNAQKASTQIHGAFTGMLGMLNRTGVLGGFGEAIAGIDEALDGLGEHGKQAGQKLMGIGAGLVGAGGIFTAIGSADQAARQQLQAAIEATGQSWDDYESQVEQAIKHEERYGQTANKTQDALRILTQATHSPAKALELLSTATDIAAAKHEDLGTAAGQLGKVYNGNTKLLKEYGIVVDKHTGKTKDGQTATQALADVLKGQASASADTFTGKLKAMTATVEDQAAKFGQKYGPAITAAGAAVTVLGGAVTAGQAVMKTFTTTSAAAAAAQDTLAASSEVATVAMDEEAAAATAADAASLPILATVGLIVLAIAALIAIAYVLYRNWSTIWGAMKTAAKAVWDWIKNNWPLLLAVILGPIGLAADLVIKNWDKIKQGASDVWRWIKDGWNDIVGFFTGLPGRIASIVTHLFDGFANAFVDAINFIIRIWNGLQFKVPGVSVFGHHFGGFTIGVPDIPQIPHLASGGLITSDGLVYAHAGEAITPMNRVGPAVAIENAHFASEVDVELFMRRAAWVVQTQGV